MKSAKPSVVQARDAILQSALHEIERVGILGLRVADVAKGANCSITQIYRYFGDRDGLLAQVLGDLYQDILNVMTESFRSRVLSKPVIAVDDVLAALPTIFSGPAMRSQHLRLQILAVSVTNAPLRQRLEQISRDQSKVWNEGLDEIEQKLVTGQKFDRRVFTMLLANLLPFYRTLLGEDGFTNEEFLTFLRDKLTT